MVKSDQKIIWKVTGKWQKEYGKKLQKITNKWEKNEKIVIKIAKNDGKYQKKLWESWQKNGKNGKSDQKIIQIMTCNGQKVMEKIT